MLRPLPPFRAKPLRRASKPKFISLGRKEADGVVVKALRLPVRFSRQLSAPGLKVLNRDGASP